MATYVKTPVSKVQLGDTLVELNGARVMEISFCTADKANIHLNGGNCFYSGAEVTKIVPVRKSTTPEKR